MSATDNLRRMLDERGVEWEAWNDCITVVPPSTHYLEVNNGALCVAVVGATPEQAIAATLGGEVYVPERTCTFSEGHDGNDTEKQELPRCSACGKDVDGAMCDMYADLGGVIVLEYPYRYCPNCGARVVL